MEEQILELIADRKFVRLRETLCEIQPADLAPLFEEMPEKDRAVVFRILPKELAADVFVELESDMQQFLIEAFSDRELKEVLDELFMDDTVDIIEEMPATVAKRILKQTDPKTRSVINRLLAYPDDSAGSIMTTEYIDLKTDMTVNDAFEKNTPRRHRHRKYLHGICHRQRAKTSWYCYCQRPTFKRGRYPALRNNGRKYHLCRNA